MGRWLSRLARVIVVAFLGLLALALGVYLTLVHPNDERMRPYPLVESLTRFKARYELKGRLFQDRLAYEASLGEGDYRSLVDTFYALYPQYMTAHSPHMRHPYQVFISAGSYPERLEGRYAFILPAGGSLTVRGVDSDGELILKTAGFAVGTGPEGADLALELLDGSVVRKLPWPEADSPLDRTSFYYRNFYRFAWPDHPVPGGRWQAHTASLPWHAKTSQVRLRCLAKSGYCVVAEPSFWQLATGKPSKPNFLVLLVDTLRADAMVSSAAPFMQSLSRRGALFTNCLAAGNMTSPSTNALLACRKPHALGPLGFSYGMSEEQRKLYYTSQPASFPRVFQDHGWQTAMLGNISVISEVLGIAIDHGFAEQVAVERDGYDTPALTREAIDWLAREGERPFFLYLHYHAPHAPYRAPLQDIWATFPGWDVFSSYPGLLRWLYQAEVHYTDRYIQRLWSALEALGLSESTHVLLTADHGDHQEVRRFLGNELGADYTGTYFDHGATLYQDEIHVPLWWHSPEQLGSGRFGELVSGLDIGPTLLELAGLSVPSWCEGVSLAEAVRRPENSSFTAGKRVISSEGFRGKALVLDGRYKYIRHYEPTDKLLFLDRSFQAIKTPMYTPEEFFDLVVDPREEDNLTMSRSARSELTRARAIYRERFAVQSVYQLVVEVPQGDEVSIELAAGLDVQLTDESGVLRQKRGQHLTLTYRDKTRFTLESPAFALGKEPIVRVAGKVLPLLKTSLKLPLPDSIAELPMEVRPPGPPPSLGRQARAYVQRLEDSRDLRHHVYATHPEFQEMLREWGYLTDDATAPPPLTQLPSEASSEEGVKSSPPIQN